MLFPDQFRFLRKSCFISQKKSITNMMDIAPEFANRKSHEQEVQVEPSELECGDIIMIRPGERIPVDSRVLSGESMVDAKALTESASADCYRNDDIQRKHQSDRGAGSRSCEEV